MKQNRASRSPILANECFDESDAVQFIQFTRIAHLLRDDRFRLRVHEGWRAYPPLEQRVLEPAVGKVAAPVGRAPALVTREDYKGVVHHAHDIQLLEKPFYLEAREHVVYGEAYTVGDRVFFLSKSKKDNSSGISKSFRSKKLISAKLRVLLRSLVVSETWRWLYRATRAP